MKFVFSIVLTVVVFFSCKKQTNDGCEGTGTIYPINAFYKQFFFNGGKWLLKDSASSVIDSIFVDYSVFGQNCSHPQMGCASDCYQGYNVVFSHNLVLGKNFHLEILEQVDNFGIEETNLKSSSDGIFNGKIGDVQNNAKIENIISKFITPIDTFQNVYQMYYPNSLGGFKRLWWCPKKGFVKAEVVDSSVNGTKIYNLISYYVSLHN